MRRALIITPIVLLLALALFYYQPWSSYSPAGMTKTFLEDERVHHFRNMDALYPAKNIPASSKPVAWPEDKKELQVSYSFANQTIPLADFLSKTNSTGLLVIKNGSIVSEQYWQGETANSQHTSWSVAKSYISTLVGMAKEDGLIKDFNDPIKRYIPELENKAYGQIAIVDALQMSSGIGFSESYGASGSNTALAMSDAQKVFYGTYLFGKSINGLVAGYDKLEEPGTRWEYRSSDTQILGWLVESVYNKPLATLIAEKLWQPLGATTPANWLVDGSSEQNAIAFCCLNATLRDFARLGELYRLGGLWNGQQLLSKQWTIDATTPSAPHVQPEAVRQFRGYQYQWWMPANHQREYFASGIWGQMIWVDEVRGVVIVRTAVDPNFQENMKESVTVMRAIAEATTHY